MEIIGLISICAGTLLISFPAYLIVTGFVLAGTGFYIEYKANINDTESD